MSLGGRIALAFGVRVTGSSLISSLSEPLSNLYRISGFGVTVHEVDHAFGQTFVVSQKK